MDEKWWMNGMELRLDTCSFGHKTATKIEKNRTGSRKGIEAVGGMGDARPCVPGSTTVPPPQRAMVGSARSPSPASRMARFILVLVHLHCLCWVILGLFLLSLIHMAAKTSSNHMF